MSLGIPLSIGQIINIGGVQNAISYNRHPFHPWKDILTRVPDGGKTNKDNFYYIDVIQNWLHADEQDLWRKGYFLINFPQVEPCKYSFFADSKDLLKNFFAYISMTFL